MEDFIASEWQFCIKLDYNESIAKSAEKIIEKAAQTAPSQTIKIEQAPVQFTQGPPKSDDKYEM